MKMAKRDMISRQELIDRINAAIPGGATNPVISVQKLMGIIGSMRNGDSKKRCDTCEYARWKLYRNDRGLLKVKAVCSCEKAEKNGADIITKGYFHSVCKLYKDSGKSLKDEIGSEQ